MQQPFIPNYRDYRKSISSVTTDLPQNRNFPAKNILQTDVSFRLQTMKSPEITRTNLIDPPTKAPLPNKTPTKDLQGNSKNWSFQIFESLVPQEPKQFSQTQPLSHPSRRLFNPPPSEQTMTQSVRKNNTQIMSPVNERSCRRSHQTNFNNATGQVRTLFSQNIRGNGWETHPEQEYEETETESNIQINSVQSTLLTRKKIETALSEMKARIMEINAFSCNCNFFRLNLESWLKRMLECAIFVGQIKGAF